MVRECLICEKEISMYDNVATMQRKGGKVYLCRDCAKALTTMYEIEHTLAPMMCSGVEEPFKIIKKRDEPIALPEVEDKIKCDLTNKILNKIYKLDIKKPIIDIVINTWRQKDEDM